MPRCCMHWVHAARLTILGNTPCMLQHQHARHRSAFRVMGTKSKVGSRSKLKQVRTVWYQLGENQVMSPLLSTASCSGPSHVKCLLNVRAAPRNHTASSLTTTGSHLWQCYLDPCNCTCALGPALITVLPCHVK